MNPVNLLADYINIYTYIYILVALPINGQIGTLAWHLNLKLMDQNVWSVLYSSHLVFINCLQNVTTNSFSLYSLFHNFDFLALKLFWTEK